jgi:hypothetical protein
MGLKVAAVMTFGELCEELVYALQYIEGARAMPIKVWIDPQWIESLNAPANAKPGCNIARVLALASRDEVANDLDAMLHNPPNGV